MTNLFLKINLKSILITIQNVLANTSNYSISGPNHIFIQILIEKIQKAAIFLDFCDSGAPHI